MLTPIEKFKTLSADGVFAMAKIEWWLLANRDLYSRTKTIWNCPRCPTEKGLPCICTQKSNEYVFMQLFEELDVLTQCHRLEPDYKKELATYYLVKNDMLRLKSWLHKSKCLNSEDFYFFILKYSSHESNIHPNLTLRITCYKDSPIIIDHKDFKHTLEFGSMFMDVVSFKSLYRESEVLQQIDKVMCQFENRDYAIRNFFFNK
jgi:hypothetical protein